MIPPTEGWTLLHQRAVKQHTPTDMSTGQSDGGNSSMEVPGYQLLITKFSHAEGIMVPGLLALKYTWEIGLSHID